MTEAIKPGVYVGLPEEAYHADPALGSTNIKQLLRDPAEYWWHSPMNPMREVDSELTIAMKFGRAYHKLILEPEKFNYDIKKGVKTTKEEGMLGEGEYKKLIAMQNALMLNPKQFAILSGGVAEVSVFWEQDHQGHKFMCKVRFDLFAPHWIADLKTSEDISDRKMRFSFRDNGYGISGAMYSIGAKALKEMIRIGYKMPPEFDQAFIDDFMSHENQIFAFVFQEKDAPHSSRCWTMSPWITSVGADQFFHGLEIYNAHKDIEGQWPTVYKTIEEISEDMVAL